MSYNIALNITSICFSKNNKSQGQSLSIIGLYNPNGPFIHGLYVALSRTTTGSKGIIVMNRTIQNIVYYEVLE
jgi:hypothetical protein